VFRARASPSPSLSIFNLTQYRPKRWTVQIPCFCLDLPCISALRFQPCFFGDRFRGPEQGITGSNHGPWQREREPAESQAQITGHRLTLSHQKCSGARAFYARRSGRAGKRQGSGFTVTRLRPQARRFASGCPPPTHPPTHLTPQKHHVPRDRDARAATGRRAGSFAAEGASSRRGENAERRRTPAGPGGRAAPGRPLNSESPPPSRTRTPGRAGRPQPRGFSRRRRRRGRRRGPGSRWGGGGGTGWQGTAATSGRSRPRPARIRIKDEKFHYI
jgi:hypothetical protein